MRPSNLLHLYWIRLRARRVQELLALTGIAAGVALLFAASVANTSLTASVERLTAGIVGRAQLQLAARSADGFDARLLARVERLPGVESAAPMLDLQANVVGPRGRRSVLLVGGDPRFARLGGAFVHAFTSQALAHERVIALPSALGRELGISIGASAALEISGRRVVAPVGVLLDAADIGDLAASRVVIAPLTYVQQLAGLRGRLTRIYVVPEPGRQALAAQELRRIADGRLNVRPARFDVRLFDKAAAPTYSSTTLFAALSAGVGFLFAFSAMLLTVPQRRRLLRDLRTDGYGPLVAVQVLLLDALLLGFAAAVLGLSLGELFSRAMFSPTPGYLGYTFPIGSQRVVTARSVLLAIGGGLLAATGAALAPPYDRAVTRQRRPLTTGALVVGATAALASTTVVYLVAPQLAVLGTLSLALAALLLVPVVLGVLVRALDALTRRWASAAPFIALVQLRGREHRLRAGAIAATGTIAVLSVVAIQGARDDLQHGLDSAAHDVDSTADVWVTAAGESNAFATTPLRTDAATRLAHLPGVATVERYGGSFLDWGDRRVWVLAPPPRVRSPAPPSQVAAAERAVANERLHAGGWVVLARQLAADHGLSVGERFTLPAPVPIRLRVAALSTNLGWPPGAAILNAADYARAWGSAAPSALQLTLVPGAQPAAVRAEAQRVLGARSPLGVETAAERERRHDASTRQALSRLSQIRTLVLVAAVLAIVAALGGLMWQRRPRIARLKLDGFSDTEVRRALTIEALILVGGGAVLGAVLGLYGQALLDRALASITGFPVELSVGLAGAFLGALAVTVAAVVLVALPGALAVRTGSVADSD